MDFSEYQKRCKKTDLFPPDGDIDEDVRIWLVEYRTLCLCGEVGELANVVKKLRRDDGRISDEKRLIMSHELGDSLWYIATLCEILDIDMGDVAKLNLEMLASRKERDKIRGDGDFR